MLPHRCGMLYTADGCSLPVPGIVLGNRHKPKGGHSAHQTQEETTVRRTGERLKPLSLPEFRPAVRWHKWHRVMCLWRKQNWVYTSLLAETSRHVCAPASVACIRFNISQRVATVCWLLPFSPSHWVDRHATFSLSYFFAVGNKLRWLSLSHLLRPLRFLVQQTSLPTEWYESSPTTGA